VHDEALPNTPYLLSNSAWWSLIKHSISALQQCMMKPYQTQHICSPAVHDEVLPNTPYLLSNSSRWN
jgi:hypothetical protein